VLALTTLLATVAVAACSGGGGSTTGEPASPPKAYEGRGLVRKVAGSHELLVHHEAIHDFTDINGNVVGMDSMTMPFMVDDAIDLSDVAPGDKISFRLEVDWDAPEPARITRIEMMPAETELVYGEAQPPS
jgi:Cu/Ag efflux protein CusF